jgi:hypothetical protein
MRTVRRYLALVLAAMASIPKAVWGGTRWTLKAMFALPVGTGGEIEEAFEDVAQAAAPTPAASAPDTVQAAHAVRKASVAEAADTVLDWGRTARAYALSRLSDAPEPRLSGLDESAELWLRSLSHDECRRVLDFDAKRVADHILGAHPILGLSRCLERPSWLPAALLAEIPGDEHYEGVKVDLARDPDSVPGYRVAA